MKLFHRIDAWKKHKNAEIKFHAQIALEIGYSIPSIWMKSNNRMDSNISSVNHHMHRIKISATPYLIDKSKRWTHAKNRQRVIGFANIVNAHEHIINSFHFTLPHNHINTKWKGIFRVGLHRWQTSPPPTNPSTRFSHSHIFLERKSCMFF